jgi:hypothetical protein
MRKANKKGKTGIFKEVRSLAASNEFIRYGLFISNRGFAPGFTFRSRLSIDRLLRSEIEKHFKDG